MEEAPILVTLGILACSVFSIAGEESWIEVRSPNFVVISDASAKASQANGKILGTVSQPPSDRAAQTESGFRHSAHRLCSPG